MTIIAESLPCTREDRLKLSSELASIQSPDLGGGGAIDSFSLMGELVKVSTKRGLYYANPANVRFLFRDWPTITVDQVQHHIEELVEWGELLFHPELAINCYGGTHDVLEIVNRRRFQRFGTRPAISEAVRSLVYARDRGRCRHCGSSEALSVDHIIPWSKGGSHDESNFQTLCRPCNSKKGARV